jgi:hypothetical protein
VSGGRFLSRIFLHKSEFRATHIPIAGIQIAPAARRAARRSDGAKAFETFCTQLETRVDFFNFSACNPLKSPDSQK